MRYSTLLIIFSFSVAQLCANESSTDLLSVQHFDASIRSKHILTHRPVEVLLSLSWQENQALSLIELQWPENEAYQLEYGSVQRGQSKSLDGEVFNTLERSLTLTFLEEGAYSNLQVSLWCRTKTGEDERHYFSVPIIDVKDQIPILAIAQWAFLTLVLLVFFGFLIFLGQYMLKIQKKKKRFRGAQDHLETFLQVEKAKPKSYSPDKKEYIIQVVQVYRAWRERHPGKVFEGNDWQLPLENLDRLRYKPGNDEKLEKQFLMAIEAWKNCLTDKEEQ